MRRLTAGLLLLTAACEDRSYRDIGADLRVVTSRDDAFVPGAMARLVGRGRRAIPQIETALHTASPAAKLRLLQVLERIADPEAAPLLRHCARWEEAPEVRARCTALSQPPQR
jgi:hypothetical protein